MSDRFVTILVSCPTCEAEADTLCRGEEMPLFPHASHEERFIEVQTDLLVVDVWGCWSNDRFRFRAPDEEQAMERLGLLQAMEVQAIAGIFEPPTVRRL